MLRVLLVGVFLLGAGPTAAEDLAIGMAVAGREGRCAVFPAGAVAAGDEVTLVVSESDTLWWSAVVTVQREVGPCEELDDEIIGDEAIASYYELSAPADPNRDVWVAIAVPGTPRLRRSASGFTAELDGRAPREHFNICATYEGLQMSIWSGLPYKGQRRAQAYFYLGYAVDPTCPDVLADAERERLKKE